MPLGAISALTSCSRFSQIPKTSPWQSCQDNVITRQPKPWRIRRKTPKNWYFPCGSNCQCSYAVVTRDRTRLRVCFVRTITSSGSAKIKTFTETCSDGGIFCLLFYRPLSADFIFCEISSSEVLERGAAWLPGPCCCVSAEGG